MLTRLVAPPSSSGSSVWKYRSSSGRSITLSFTGRGWRPLEPRAGQLVVVMRRLSRSSISATAPRPSGSPPHTRRATPPHGAGPPPAPGGPGAGAGADVGGRGAAGLGRAGEARGGPLAGGPTPREDVLEEP